MFDADVSPAILCEIGILHNTLVSYVAAVWLTSFHLHLENHSDGEMHLF